MQPLQTVLDKAHASLKLTRPLQECKLLLNGKQLDLSQPFRFCNLANNTLLELHTGNPRSPDHMHGLMGGQAQAALHQAIESHESMCNAVSSSRRSWQAFGVHLGMPHLVHKCTCALANQQAQLRSAITAAPVPGEASQRTSPACWPLGCLVTVIAGNSM